MRYRNGIGVDTKYVDTNHTGSTEPLERSHVSPMVLDMFDGLYIRVSIHRDDDRKRTRVCGKRRHTLLFWVSDDGFVAHVELFVAHVEH
jgi:hypothetical protein